MPKSQVALRVEMGYLWGKKGPICTGYAGGLDKIVRYYSAWLSR